MKARVAAGEQPWLDSWNALLANGKAQSSYNPAPQANMGASRQRASADAVAAYLNAIRGYIADSPGHTDNAIRICNLWSAAVNQVPSGGDQPGLSGLYCYQFAVVGEMLRIHVGTRWAPEDFERFKDMVRAYLYPIVHDFLVRHNNACISHYWTNWDAANIAALAAIGVLLDDQAIFDEGIEYFQTGAGNGSIQNAVYHLHPGGPDQPYGLGQWQETGRDQEHNILGVGLLATFCQIAWNQGVDMFGYDNNRLLAGAEYVAQFAIGQEVPYAFFDNCDDVNQYWPATHDRGRLQRPIWELLYNHYVVRQGLSAPSLTAIAALNRPEAFSHDDHFGYGTLAFTLNAAASGYPTVAPAVPEGLISEGGVGRVNLRWNVVPTANGYIVQRATASGGPYSEIARYRGAIPTYSDSGVSNGTTYYYRVAAMNQSGTSGESTEVSATPLADGPVLPDGWMRRDVGAVAAAGSARYGTPAGGTFFVSGSGSGIGGTADGMGFAFATVDGDAIITAHRIGGNLSGAGGNGRMGLMFRESLAPDAKTQTLVVGDLGFREARFGTRATTGGEMSFITGNGYSAGAWFRLVRSGNTFSAFQSGDGITWHFVGTTEAVMPAVVHVGIAVGANSASVIRGDFDHVALDAILLPGAPTGLAALNGHGQVSLSWSASAGATSYDVKRAPMSGGPYTIIASGVTGTNYVDAGLVDGTNTYYVVSARVGDYESVNSEEALGTPGDINFIWSETPVSGNWSAGANWLGGSPPEDGSSLAFGATTVASLTNDLAGFSVNRLAFNSGASAYTIGGNALGVSGDIANNSATAQTVALNLTLNTTPTIDARNGMITLGGVVSDGGAGHGITKTGTQSLSLTGANTFSGDVDLAAGTLTIAGVGAGTAGAPTSGALGRGTVRLTGGVLTSSSAARIYNNVVIPAGAMASIASSSANITFAGNISGGGTINESGGNTGGTHFNGDNSGFTGVLNSSNAGGHRIRFNTPTAGSASATWVLNNSQADGNGFAFPGGTGTIAFGALSGSGVFRNNTDGTVTMRIGDLNTDTTITGVFVSNGARRIAVDKVGTGRLTLTGGHTYDGPTTVSAGTLIVNGSLRNTVTAKAGATFGGTASATASIMVDAGGTFAPGNQGIGNLTTTGALTLHGGAMFAVELDSTAGTADKATTRGVTLENATLALTDIAPGALPLGTTLTLIDNTGDEPVGGTFNGLPEGSVLSMGGNAFCVSYHGGTGNDVVLYDERTAPALITSANTATGEYGSPFSYTITAVNSPTSFGATNLPAGLTVNTATGEISGTAGDVGEFTVTLSATNDYGSGTASLTLTLLAVDPPPAPASLTASAISNTQIGLSWSAAQFATSYQVKRSTVSGGPYTTIATVAGTSYSDAGLSNGATYYYIVAGVNSVGVGSDSEEASATPYFDPALEVFSSSDVGSVGFAGSSSYSPGGIVTLRGSGADIWGNADGFAFLHRPFTGDGAIVARVLSLQNTHSAAKAGVMMRESLAAGSRHAMSNITAVNGVEFIRRQSTNGSTSAASSGGVQAPRWVRLVRSGNSFSAFHSADGKSWSAIGGPISIGMTASPISIGLAVNSHNNSAIAEARFDHVNIASALPEITSATSATGVYGAPFSYAIAATHTPYLYGASDLPAGVVLDADTGLISGNPTQSGVFTVTLGAYNAMGGDTETLTLSIEKATATVTLGDLTQFYDGAPRAAMAVTDPEGLAVEVKYDGSGTPPIFPGEYAVVATINDNNYEGSAVGTLVIRTTALVRHAPTIDGDLDGSVQVLLPEWITLNSGAAIASDLLVPGTPALYVNGQPVYAGVIDGPGAADPATHAVTLNSGSVLRFLVRRIDAIAMPIVDAPPAPAGTRDVSISKAGQSAGDFATLRNLTLNSKAGKVAVPPGTYGRFTANGSSIFVLGVAGATEPSIYNLHGLTLNSGAQLQLVGPVTLTLANGSTFDGSVNGGGDPAWLTLRIANGGLTLNSGVELHGDVVAPSGTISINRSGSIVGAVTADYLTINSQALLEKPQQ